MIGYVPLYRKIKEWEWYDEANTMRLFIHCLVSANHKDNKWRGVLVKKGSFITSVGNLAHELKLTKQKIRTAINNLQSTNEITLKTTHHYTMINVVNWHKYEINNNKSNTPNNTQNNERSTHAQHTLNTRLTTNKNVKNVKNVKNEENINDEKVLNTLSCSVEKDTLPFKEIIAYLNLKANTSFKHQTAETRKLIKARFNQKFTLQDFYTVIDKKTEEWIGTDQEIYLRPQTLFSTKFEGYLNQKTTKKKTMKDIDIDTTGLGF